MLKAMVWLFLGLYGVPFVWKYVLVAKDRFIG